MRSPIHGALRVSAGTSPRNLRDFVRLWDVVYHGDPQAVRPFPSEVAGSLGGSDPYLRRGEREVFMVATADEQPLARAVAWFDPVSSQHFDTPTGLFSHFESVDFAPAVDALLEAVRGWLQSRGAVQVIGPMSPKASDPVGVLVHGPGRPAYGMPYNPPYYPHLLEGAGLTGIEDLLQQTIRLAPDYPRMRAVAALARERYPALTIRGFNVADFEADIRNLVTFYNRTNVNTWGFLPIDFEEFWEAAKEFRRVYRPEYGLLAELDGEIVSMVITIPDVNEVLHRMRGRLWPFGWWHLATGLRRIRALRGIFIGTDPRFRLAGIEALLMSEMLDRILCRDITNVHLGWTPESNSWLHSQIEREAGPENVTRKRYRVYRDRITERQRKDHSHEPPGANFKV